MSAKILLDANVLISQHFLKGHLGIALVHALRNTSGQLVLPEATYVEARAKALHIAEKRRTAIITATDQLQVLLGSRPNIDWPPIGAIASAIDDHLDAISDILERPPIDLDLVRHALERVIKRKAPAHNSEQFRDALLWEFAAQLSRGCDVHFVTNDGDFLSREDGKKRLNPDLRREIDDAGLLLTHHLDVPSLLTALGPTAQQPDHDSIARSLGDYLKPRLLKELDPHDLVVEEQLQTEARAFATPNPNDLAVSFDVGFQGYAGSNASTSTTDATINAIGSASVDPRTYDVTGVQLERVDVTYPEGSTMTGGGIQYINPRSNTTRSWRPYDFRFPLDPQ